MCQTGIDRWAPDKQNGDEPIAQPECQIRSMSLFENRNSRCNTNPTYPDATIDCKIDSTRPTSLGTLPIYTRSTGTGTFARLLTLGEFDDKQLVTIVQVLGVHHDRHPDGLVDDLTPAST